MNLPFYSFLIFLCFAFAGCSSDKDRKAVATPAVDLSQNEVSLTDGQKASIGIETGRPAMRVISGVLKVNGTLDVPPQNLVSVSAPLGGFVKHTDLLQGMKVKKGQLLVTLEGPEYIQLQEDYLSSKGQLEFLSQEYERQRELSSENVTAAKTFQLSRSNYLTMKARKEGLEAKMKMVNLDPILIEKGEIQATVNIVSPISGFVSQVNINLGMHVNPTDVMLRVIDTDHLHAEALVYDKDITAIRVGQKIRLRLANDARERTATVYLIGKEVSADRTVRVHCHFDEEDPTLIPGLFFEGQIEVSNHEVSALPDKAVVTFEGKKFVFVVAGPNRYSLVEIKTGDDEGGYIQVSLPDSLASSDIVFTGAYQLLSQLKNSENDH